VARKSTAGSWAPVAGFPVHWAEGVKVAGVEGLVHREAAEDRVRLQMENKLGSHKEGCFDIAGPCAEAFAEAGTAAPCTGDSAEAGFAGLCAEGFAVRRIAGPCAEVFVEEDIAGPCAGLFVAVGRMAAAEGRKEAADYHTRQRKVLGHCCGWMWNGDLVVAAVAHMRGLVTGVWVSHRHDRP